MGVGLGLDAGSYVQLTNALLAVYRALGLERRAKEVPGLEAYVERAYG